LPQARFSAIILAEQSFAAEEIAGTLTGDIVKTTEK